MKSGKVLLLLGVPGLLLAVTGLVFAYYYAWRLMAPGLPVEMRPRYETLSMSIGLTSLAVTVASLVAIGCGVRRWIKNRPAASDWGWCVMVRRKPYPLFIACANSGDHVDRWGAFVVAERGLQSLFRGTADARAAVETLSSLVEDIMKQVD